MSLPRPSPTRFPLPSCTGFLELFDERLIEALHVTEGLLRSPDALALLLEAAGQVALERAGAILDERIPGHPRF